MNLTLSGPPARIGIIIPALDEQETVGDVVRRCREAARNIGEARIVVADNGSRDRTVQAAREAGAETVTVPKRGYGLACLAGIKWLGTWPDALIFVDADGSSRPEEMDRLLRPILEGEADLTLGHRFNPTHMSWPQRVGNRLAPWLIGTFWGRRFHDIGPFRAITGSAYRQLKMQDKTWGWTVEMQILALENEFRIVEVPVSWEARVAGVSKISGTVLGVLRAGIRILWTIARYALIRHRSC